MADRIDQPPNSVGGIISRIGGPPRTSATVQPLWASCFWTSD